MFTVSTIRLTAAETIAGDRERTAFWRRDALHLEQVGYQNVAREA
jgi:hypothetical protein